MMKRKIFYLIALFACFYFSSCTDENEDMGFSELSISSFYPTIVMDGTEVTIAGAALNTVTEVVFPDGKSSTDITIVDDKLLKVIAPTDVSETAAPLVLRSSDSEVSSRQTIKKAKTLFSSYIYSDNEGAVTGSELTISGTDLLLVEKIRISDENKTIEIPSLEMIRKSNDAIKFTVPEDSPMGENIKVTLVFENGSSMNLPDINIIEGSGGGTWVEKEVVLYDGEPVATGGWSTSLQVPNSDLPELKVGDVIRVYISDVESGAQGSLKCTADGWPGIDTEFEYFDITQQDIDAGYYMCTLTENAISNLSGNNLIVAGQNYTITKVSVFTSVFVEDTDDAREPITDKTVILMDFETTEGHNASWDNSWTQGVELEFPTENNGNIYARLKTTVDGEIWLLNCNHVDRGTVSNIENYAVKFDLMIEEGVTGASQAAMQLILADNWLWVGQGFFPETTNGKWITVSYKISDLNADLTGDFTFGTNTNGMYGSDVPAGINIDNLRLDPIE